MMPDDHCPPGTTSYGPAYLLPRYPVKVPRGWDATPSHRRYPIRYPIGHQSQPAATYLGHENQVEHGSLPLWLPQETISAEDKVNAWLNDKSPYAKILTPNKPASTPSTTRNNSVTSPAPSGHPFAIKKAKSIVHLLYRAVSKPTLRIPLQLKKTKYQNSSLDSEITCRGLPNMMIKKEMTVTASKTPTNDSTDKPAQAAHEEVIASYQYSMVITPDENVKVTKFKADANDESLQRYKKSLGLGGGSDLSDPNDPRVCIIQSLTMDSAGRPPVTIDLSQPGSESTLKDKPFKIKEGAKFTMVASFRVQHEILSGLQYVQTVKRKGIRVSKDSEMLGSYAPNTDKQPLYSKRFQEEDAPSGMLARGHYNAVSTFVDDDKKQHLQFEWSFDISKDW
ncbi:hypothetical protein E0Z10_g3371 [Xylaria hypoxylon]|uniref:Rho GDP-dissociation inhibitor n=1 Tax=Xylaria hypoxylon TaxID=37992 RepID=A0A4Z0Z3S6_9PEZI|nr:hypothetical protein E0Z10_g3371 [Xylaria hypoxylon]